MWSRILGKRQPSPEPLREQRNRVIQRLADRLMNLKRNLRGNAIVAPPNIQNRSVAPAQQPRMIHHLQFKRHLILVQNSGEQPHHLRCAFQLQIPVIANVRELIMLLSHRSSKTK